MAKLSAYGQREVARYSKERDVSKEQYEGDRNPVVYERITYAFMDNGRVLQKRDVRWADGMKHTYGWNVALPAKKDRDVSGLIDRLTSKGFERVAA